MPHPLGLQPHKRSTIEADQKKVLEEREAELLQRVNGVIAERETRPLAEYLMVLQMACDTNGLDLERGR